ncbi:DUF4935 domain-containing protein [Rhizobium lentis]|uniref:PIN domain-containing protein n=1 Tax=Rhizobium lentis TaxID=1138194 RepID=UPI001C83018E|nr:PIN domain-containing protein [Rhizobium lentis]MBX5152589.1 DUF4935 domain-containing protein [Rhizobium lentis]
MTTKPARQKAEPLRTRHVFFDTEVYRRAGFNVRNSQFSAFAKYVDAGRLSLHTTDITFAEVNRQITEDAADKVARLNKIGKDFGRISQFSGEIPKLPEIDQNALAQSMWRGVLDVLVNDFSANHIHAMNVPPRKIFDKYFAGKAPFEKRGSKEFPDAFIVEALAEYCSKYQIKMYVVSGDAAMRDAAGSQGALIPLVSIDELLAACAAEADVDLEPLAEALFGLPDFDEQLIQALNDESGYMEGIYFGTLDDGTISEIFVDEIKAIDGYTLAAIDDDSVSLILEMPCILRATVNYVYVDPDVPEEDGSYVTPASESSRAHVELKLYVRFDRATGKFLETELLTKRAIFE